MAVFQFRTQLDGEVLLDGCQKLGRRHAQGMGEFHDDVEGRVPTRALEPTDVCPVEANMVSEGLLGRPSSSMAQLPEVFSESDSVRQVVHISNDSATLTMSPRTMSHIRIFES